MPGPCGARVGGFLFSYWRIQHAQRQKEPRVRIWLTERGGWHARILVFANDTEIVGNKDRVETARMQATLVRVGIDQAYGGWNSPMDPSTSEFLYTPIPESADSFLPGCKRRFEEAVLPLQRFLRTHQTEEQASRFPIAKMAKQPMHLDPDFEYLTYGDDGSRRGASIQSFSSGDLLVFYAGLRPIRPSSHKLVYAIIGLFVIDEIIRVTAVAKDRRHENAHTRKKKLCPSDIVVRAQKKVSGRCSRCIPIGEYRDRAYRVRRELIDEWGGLSVENGFIQRSAVPPRFNDARAFLAWWRRQRIPLVQDNFGS